MAVIFTTGFESYADGDASLTANGWTPAFGVGPHICSVVSTDAHAGTKSVQFGADVTSVPGSETIDTPQSMNHAIAPSGSSVSLEMWVKSPSPILSPQSDNPNPSVQLWHSSDGTVTIAGYTSLRKARAAVASVMVGESAGNVIPDGGVYFSIRVQAHMSTVNAARTGVNADGCVSVYINGVRVVAVAGIAVWVTQSGWASGINYAPDRIVLGFTGWVDDVTVTDDAMPCGSSNGPPPSGNPCCGDEPPTTPPDTPPGTPPGTNPGPVDPPDPFTPLPPWIASCAGGGTVPTAADETDSESWVH